MKSIHTILRNSKLLFKLTGKFQFKKETLRKGRIYLPPFEVRVNKEYIAIVLAYVDRGDSETLMFKEIWLNSKIFSSSELIDLKNRNPYFETIIGVLDMYMKAFNLTFNYYKIKQISYMFYIKNEKDEMLAEVLRWYGFKMDMPRTLSNFVPKTTWREREMLSFYIYTKKLI